MSSWYTDYVDTEVETVVPDDSISSVGGKKRQPPIAYNNPRFGGAYSVPRAESALRLPQREARPSQSRNGRGTPSAAPSSTGFGSLIDLYTDRDEASMQCSSRPRADSDHRSYGCSSRRSGDDPREDLRHSSRSRTRQYSSPSSANATSQLPTGWDQSHHPMMYPATGEYHQRNSPHLSRSQSTHARPSSAYAQSETPTDRGSMQRKMMHPTADEYHQQTPPQLMRSQSTSARPYAYATSQAETDWGNMQEAMNRPDTDTYYVKRPMRSHSARAPARPPRPPTTILPGVAPYDDMQNTMRHRESDRRAYHDNRPRSSTDVFASNRHISHAAPSTSKSCGQKRRSCFLGFHWSYKRCKGCDMWKCERCGKHSSLFSGSSRRR